jgi:hypothetical protein
MTTTQGPVQTRWGGEVKMNAFPGQPSRCLLMLYIILRTRARRAGLLVVKMVAIGRDRTSQLVTGRPDCRNLACRHWVLPSIARFKTTASILSTIVGASAGFKPLPLTAASPGMLVLTTAAVAVTGLGVTGAVVTEKACADHRTQSPMSLTPAESEEPPAADN